MQWVELAPGGRQVRLLMPADPERLLDAAGAIEAAGCAVDLPYWAYLWPSAHMLAEVVARRRWPEGTRVLEIGCGLGYAGLAGLAAGLSVDFTDRSPEALQFVEQSARASGAGPARWSTSRLDWRDPPDRTYSVILGADVLYERPLVPLVVNLIARMLEPGGEALLAGPYRVATESLEPLLAERGLTWTVQNVEAVDQAGRTQRGMLHRIGWSGAPD